ncbi:structural protein [Caudoviricetes sp.]|nr:structural protein [Caudoviricetes sp.]
MALGTLNNLQPSPQQVPTATNYITNFNFLNQYLPDTYEKEFERFGNRSVSAFLRMVGAEMPSNSDLVKWSEQGRLHTKYTNVVAQGALSDDTATFLVNDTLIPSTGGTVNGIAIRKGQTVMITPTATSSVVNKGIVIAVNTTANTFQVAFYEGAGQAFAVNTVCTVMVYGSEFKKGANGMIGSLEAESIFKENSPIIIKDKYAVNGSDMAQIGWVEVTTENGATGFLWYLKSEHETRLRFEDYLETSMLEAVPAETGSGVVSQTTYTDAGTKGSKGVFYAVNADGNVWSGGYPTNMADFDTIVAALDKQGAIEENVLFVNRKFSFAIDDFLAQVSGYAGSGSAANAASFGLFENDMNMALNLGFSGFRRGYDFYKSDWKYLNDITMRGGLTSTGAAVNGMLVPAGSTTVYDQILGKNAKRPFLHVRYRASETEDRRYKTWITGSAGGAQTSDLDAMEVHFLSERCVCVLGANNFVVFKG